MTSPAESAPSPAAPPVSRQIHLGLVVLFIVGLFVQFYLAGRGAFGASTYSTHKDVGWMLHTFTLAFLIITVILPATRNRIDIGLAVALVVLVTIQVILGNRDHPDAGAFHAVNALLVVGLAFGMLKRDRTQLAAGS
jgi:uncharacterized protein DUF6220